MNTQKLTDVIRDLTIMLDAVMEENEVLRGGNPIAMASTSLSIDPYRIADFLIKTEGDGKKINQIKLLRSITYWTLVDSKNFVERYCFEKDGDGNPNLPRKIKFGDPKIYTSGMLPTSPGGTLPGFGSIKDYPIMPEELPWEDKPGDAFPNPLDEKPHS